MAFESIGQAYLELRPDLTRFRSEVKTGVREATHEAVRDAAKVALGAFAITGVSEFIHEIGSAASRTQATLAQVAQTAKNVTGATAEQQRELGHQVEQNAARTGFAVQQVGEAYGRLLVATKSQTRAATDLQLAENIARGRHIDLAQAATVLSRAEQGSTTSLSRLGIILPKVSTAHDALAQRIGAAKKQLADLTSATTLNTAAGDKQTHTQRILTLEHANAIKSEIALLQSQESRAKVMDGLASRTSVLAALQARFGGQTEAYNRTAAGATDRFKVSVEELQATIGQHYLPRLADLLTATSDWLNGLQTSKRFQADLNAVEKDAAQILGEVRDVVKTVAPYLFQMAEGAAKVAGAIGAGPILTYIVAVRTAQALIARFSAGEATAATTSTAATAAAREQTAAVVALTEALAAQAVAGRSAAAANLLGARTAPGSGVLLAGAGARAGEREVATVAERGLLARGAGGIGRSALGLVGLGGLSAEAAAATGGVALLAGGLYYLSTIESQVHRASRELSDSLDTLGSSAHNVTAAATAIKQTRANVTGDQLAATSARLSITQAQQQLAMDRATHASRLQILSDLQGVRAAEATWRDSNHRLREALAESKKATDDLRTAERSHEQALNNVTQRLEASLDAGRQATVVQNSYRGQTVNAAAAQDALKHAADRAISTLEAQRRSYAASQPVLARNIGYVESLIRVTGKVPPRVVTNYLLEHGSADASFRALFAKLEAYAKANPSTTAHLDTSQAFAALEALANEADGVKARIDAALGAAHDTPPGLANLPDVFQAQADKADQRAQASVQAKRDKDAKAAVDAQKKKDRLVQQAQAADAANAAKAQAADQRKADAQAAQQAADDLRQKRAQLAEDNKQLAIARAQAQANQVHPTPKEIAQQVAAAVTQAKANLISLGQSLAGEVGAVIDAMTAKATGAIQRQLDAETRAAQTLSLNRALADAQKNAARSAADQPLEQQLLTEQLAQAQEALAALQKAAPQQGQTANDRALAITQAQLQVTQAQRALDDFPQQVTDAQQQVADAQRAIADSALTDQQQQLTKRGEAEKAAAARRIADLTDEFNRGSITAKTFNQRVAALLKTDNVDYKDAGALLGRSFADGFKAELATLAAQVAALFGFTPKGGGGGQAGTVVSPGLTRSQLLAQKRAALADAQQRVADAKRNLAQAQATGSAAGGLPPGGGTGPGGSYTSADLAKYRAAQGGNIRTDGSAAADIVSVGSRLGLSRAELETLVAEGIQESGLSYKPGAGDGGTSFGPFQFHIGGALGSHSRSWAESIAEVYAQAARSHGVVGGSDAAALQGPADKVGYARSINAIIASGKADAIINRYLSGGGSSTGGGASAASYARSLVGSTSSDIMTTLGGATDYTAPVTPAGRTPDEKRFIADLRSAIQGVAGVHIDKLEVHAEGNGDPAAVARLVVSEINKATRKARS